MKTYDRSLTEVWEWKEKVCNESEGLPLAAYVKRIRDEAESILGRTHINLTTISLSDKSKRVA